MKFSKLPCLCVLVLSTPQGSVSLKDKKEVYKHVIKTIKSYVHKWGQF